ncbi:MAG: S8 family serine peptidase [Vicinamibacterales bacterium]
MVHLDTPSSLTSADSHAHAHTLNRYAVIPVPRRLNAVEGATGRGVTIAFLDSGFSRHPDLVDPVDRIVAFESMSTGSASAEVVEPAPWQWHGTQTSVVCAGNGALSGGFYRGLACEASLALFAAGQRGRIRDADIVRGLERVLARREELGIRVLNLSLGGDIDERFEESPVDRLAESAVAAGIVVVVAAGNAGCTNRATPLPPANSPSVITVGGFDDGNRVEGEGGLYCSSYGITVDGLLKPEIIAPAMWVAAPLLAGTEEYRRATALSLIEATPDALLPDLPWTVWRDAGLPARLRVDGTALRAAIADELRRLRLVATHYQHVDGTSFAAPIVSSVVAQMLEVNPALTPATIKNILISTARRLPHSPVSRQGYGLLDARAAVELARLERHALEPSQWRAPFCDGGAIVFTLHGDHLSRAALAGDFNGWNPSQTPLARGDDGLWRVRVEGITPGSYRYKFVVDDGVWLEDPSNGRRDADGLGGFNSIVTVG